MVLRHNSQSTCLYATVGVKMEAGWLIVGLAGVDAMFESLLLSDSLSPTRFGASGGETAGGGGCWRCPNTEGEDQALCLQQPAGLWVSLLLPSGYHLGQYSQVSMRNRHKYVWMHTWSKWWILGWLKVKHWSPAAEETHVVIMVV